MGLSRIAPSRIERVVFHICQFVCQGQAFLKTHRTVPDVRSCTCVTIHGVCACTYLHDATVSIFSVVHEEMARILTRDSRHRVSDAIPNAEGAGLTAADVVPLMYK